MNNKPEIVYCPQCGFQNKGESAFCRKCGYKFRKEIKKEEPPLEKQPEERIVEIENVARALELGDKYYAQNDFVKAGEYYRQAYNQDPDRAIVNDNVFAYMLLRKAKEESREPFKLSPGVVVLGRILPQLDRGSQNFIALALFNSSDKNAQITITPRETKWFSFEKKGSTVDLLPGQFICEKFMFSADLDTPVKDYGIKFDVTSEATRYRAADKGIEMTAKVAV